MQHQSKTHDPISAYRARVDSGKAEEDAAQQQVAARFQALHETLKPKGMAALWKRKSAPRGIYLWGNVGRGKSMLMDLFFDTAPVAKKRRVHFHAFMQEVHARIHAHRQQQTNSSPIRGEVRRGASVAPLEQQMPPPLPSPYRGGNKYTNPVEAVAEDLAREVRLLCLDEFQVTDITDAMILSQFFTRLIVRGVTLVTTSNFPPESLYADGLQREHFLPFIALVQAKLDVVSLSSKQDYRLRQLAGFRRVYFFPADAEAAHHIAETKQLLACHPPITELLEVHGRSLPIDKLAGGVGEASFAELCGQALGAADYLAIARRFHTLFLYDIPAMSTEKRNEAKRFVTLIDALYEHKVKLICTAAAPPQSLYPQGDGSFEFQRTASRLIEMQSQPYLEAGHLW